MAQSQQSSAQLKVSNPYSVKLPWVKSQNQEFIEAEKEPRKQNLGEMKDEGSHFGEAGSILRNLKHLQSI